MVALKQSYFIDKFVKDKNLCEKMIFRSMVRSAAENKAEHKSCRRPAGLKVGTYLLPTKPTGDTPQVDTNGAGGM